MTAIIATEFTSHPSGSFYGTAQWISDGYVSLAGSGSHTSQQGSFVVASSAVPVRSFQVDFSASIKDGPDGAQGDGMSFGYGPGMNTSFGEEGVGASAGAPGKAGLWLSIDTLDNDNYWGYNDSVGVSVWYNGSQLANYPTSVSAVRGGHKSVSMTMRGDGLLTVSHPAIGEKIVQVANWNPGSNWRFGAGARTGSHWDWHVLENLYITDDNVAPSVSLPTSKTFNEGTNSVTITASGSDGNQDPITYAWDTNGDGTYDTSTGSSPNYSFVPGNGPRDFTIRVRVSDGRDVATDSTAIHVNNVAPTVPTLTRSPAGSINEGSSTVTFTASSTDPADNLTYYFDFNNDETTYEASGSSSVATYTFPDSGTYQVNVVVRDPDGGVNRKSTSVVVANLIPTISSVTNSGPVMEGTPVSVTVSATDAGGAADPLTYSFDFQNNGFDNADDVTNSTGIAQHVFPDNGTYQVNVRVRDDEGGTRFSTTTVTVNNQAPQVTLVENNGPVFQGSPAVVSVTAADPAGDLDPLTYLFDFDDNGTFEAESTIGAQATVFFDPGTHHVRVGVRDDDGAVTTSYTDVSVLSVTPSVEVDGALPRVSFTESYRTKPESNSTFLVTARLSRAAESMVVIPVAIAGTAQEVADYSIVKTITIPVGQLTGFTTVQILNDTLPEGNETIVVRMLPPTNASLSTFPGDPLTQTITILANDAPTVQWEMASTSRNENSGLFTLSATMDVVSAGAVIVPLTYSGTALPGLDFSALPTSLAFEPNSRQASLEIPLLNDFNGEVTEQLIVRLGTPSVIQASGPAQPGLLGATATMTLNIQDDDTPKVSFSSLEQTLWEDAGPAVVVIQMSNTAADDLWVSMYRSGSASSLTDYTPSGFSPQAVKIPAGQSSVAVTVANIINDFTDEGSILKTIQVRLWNDYGGVELAPTISNTRYVLESVEVGTSCNFGVCRPAYEDQYVPHITYTDPTLSTISIKDDDVTVFFEASDGKSIPEAVGTVTRNLKLSKAINRDTSAYLYTSGKAVNGADYTFNESWVTVAAGTDTAPIQIPIINDLFDESDEAVVLTLFAASFGASIGRNSSTTISIRDDDSLIVGFNVLDSDYPEDVGNVRLAARLSAPSLTDVTMRVVPSGTATRDEDFEILDEWITIPAGQLEGAITVRIIDDGRVGERDEINFSIQNLSHGVVSDAAGRHSPMVIRDNDFPPNVPPSTVAYQPVYQPTVGTLSISAAQLGPVDSHSLNAGNSQQTDTQMTAFPPGTVLGVTASSQLSGGVVFFDANKNENLDPGEISTTSALDGSFLLTFPSTLDIDGDGRITPAEGQLAMVGSIDPATGLSFTGTLLAPAGSYVISPLTTLMALLVNQQLEAGLTPDGVDARFRVAAAFGLSPVDLSFFDATSQTRLGNADGAIVYAGQAKVYNTVKQIASLIAGMPDTPPRATLESLVFADIARKISHPDANLDLSDPVVVETVLRGVLNTLGATSSTTLLTGAANIIAAGNSYIDAIPIATDVEYMQSIAQVKKLIQGVLANELTLAAVGQVSITSLVNQNTGSALANRIAGMEIGNVFAPELYISDAELVEGDDGVSYLEFAAILVGESVTPVRVHYETTDGTATAAAGDYESDSNVLTWAPGDVSPKVIRIGVNGDEQFEGDEEFAVLLSQPENAVVRRFRGGGSIVNDDALLYTAPDAGTENSLELEINGDWLLLRRNRELLIETKTSAAQITIIGADGVDDTLDVRLLNGGKLPTGGLSFLGNGTDRLNIYDESLAANVVLITNGVNGEFSFDETTIHFTGVVALMDLVTKQNHVIEVTGGADRSLELSDDADSVNGLAQLAMMPTGMLVNLMLPKTSLRMSTGGGADHLGLGALEPAFAASVDIATEAGDDMITLFDPASDATYWIDGGTGDDDYFFVAGKTANVSNVAANVFPGLDGIIAEAEVFLRSGYFTDPGTDVWTATVDFGDGTGVQPLELESDKSYILEHVYVDNGDYLVTVKVQDEDGDWNIGQFTMAVTNVAPIVTLEAIESIQEDGIATLVGTIVDPGVRDTFKLDVNWGDPLSPNDIEVVDLLSPPAHVTWDFHTRQFSLTHQYLDDNPSDSSSDTYTIRVQVTDDDTESGWDETTVTVVNTAPTASDNSYITSQAFQISGNVLIDGIADHDVAGLVRDPLRVIAVTKPANGKLVWQADGHFEYTPDTTFAGTDQFTYTISDDDSDTDSAIVTIVVQPAAPGSILILPDTLLGGTALLISGSPNADHVTVDVGATLGTLKVTFNGVRSFVPKPSGRIIVTGGAGNDIIQIGGGVPNPGWLYGDSGHDRLNAGNGDSFLFGGDGNDELLGGSGRDVMIAGEGADRLLGNNGDDILIAGYTKKDQRDGVNHDEFWGKIAAVWTDTSRRFADRVMTLHTPLLDEVIDDVFADSVDILNGAAGEDWLIFQALEDKVSGNSEWTN